MTQLDPYGQAALLLVESLIHGLCEKETIRTEEAIEIVERAVSVQLDSLGAAEGDIEQGWGAHTLLLEILASLQTDKTAIE